MRGDAETGSIWDPMISATARHLGARARHLPGHLHRAADHEELPQRAPPPPAAETRAAHVAVDLTTVLVERTSRLFLWVLAVWFASTCSARRASLAHSPSPSSSSSGCRWGCGRWRAVRFASTSAGCARPAGRAAEELDGRHPVHRGAARSGPWRFCSRSTIWACRSSRC